MKVTPSNVNTFTFFKLPAAWWCGVRVNTLTEMVCEVRVRHRWINQNPFRSMFWAVQGMAAELSTGTLLMQEMTNRKITVSMLLVGNKSKFTKKATGRIRFTCNQGDAVKKAFEQAVESKEGVAFWLDSKGVDASGDVVSEFSFCWSIKLKNT